MKDLDSRTEVHDLVVRFYREVALDDLLAPVFGEVAEVDWSVHIPVLIDFWCRVLLGQPGYDGQVLAAHDHVHQRQAFTPELFERWYALFSATVDEGWSGPIADTAKRRAAHLGGVLSQRLLGARWQPAGTRPSLTMAAPEGPGGAASAGQDLRP